jgi:predicted Zn-dependent protease
MLRYFATGLILLCLCGCVGVYNPATGKKEYYIFDDKAEIAWGNNLAKQLAAETKMVNNEEMRSALEKLGDKIALASHRNYLDYHFYIVDSEVINAFALPGGHVFVNSGLLEKLDEDQVAFVMAHEIAHICSRHALKKFEANLGYTLLTIPLIIASKQADTKKSLDQIYSLIALGYSRGDELQSDTLALKYAKDSGYDPRAALEVFEIFKVEEKKGGASSVPVYLRTHPVPQVRIDNVHKVLKEWQEKEKAAPAPAAEPPKAQ